MSDSNGGPRVWNRADVESLLKFAAGGSYVSDSFIPRAIWLMKFIESFPHQSDPLPRVQVAAALTKAAADTEESHTNGVEPRGGAWTAERRAAQSERMQKRYAEQRASKAAARDRQTVAE